jgi:hypothetical protein
MEILAIQFKSEIVPNQSAGFTHRSAPEWQRTSSRTESSSIRVLRTSIPALKNDQYLIVTQDAPPRSVCADLTEFCEVFYHLDRGQWFVMPTPSDNS